MSTPSVCAEYWVWLRLLGSRISGKSSVKCVYIIWMSISIFSYYPVSFRGQGLIEPRREKTGFLHMRKQRRRSASW